MFLATTDISPVFLRFRLEFETAPIIPSRVPCCVFSLVRIPFLCANANYTNGLSHFRPRRPVLRFSHSRRFFFLCSLRRCFFFRWGDLKQHPHASCVLLSFGVWYWYRLCVPMPIVQTVSHIYTPTDSSRLFTQPPFSCVFGPSIAQRRHLHLEILYASGPAPVLQPREGNKYTDIPSRAD